MNNKRTCFGSLAYQMSEMHKVYKNMFYVDTVSTEMIHSNWDNIIYSELIKFK